MRIHRQLGTVKSEVVSIDTSLISVRLEDGSFLGGEIELNSEGKFQLKDGHEPLAYTPEIVELILKEGWNLRSSYGDIEDLAAKIAAVGKVITPLSLIFDKNRLFIEDGHRRHHALWVLQQHGINIKECLAYVKSLGKGCSIRTLEYDILTHGSNQLELSVIEKAKLIARHEKEDRLLGLTERESKLHFLEQTGWTDAEYETVKTTLYLPANIKQAISDRRVATTTILNILKDKELNLTEIEEILNTAITEASALGKNKVTSTNLIQVKEQYLQQKEPNRQRKHKKIKPTARDKANLLDRVISEALSIATVNNQTSITIDKSLFKLLEDIYNN